MGKLLFFDIDGTLVGYDSVMPESAVEALRAAQLAGHKIFICTGRSKNQIYQHLLEFGFDGIVSATGGYVEYNGIELYHSVFGEENLKNVMDCFKDTQAGILLQRRDDNVSSEKYEKVFIKAFSEQVVVKRMSDMQAFQKIIMDNDIDQYPEKYYDTENVLYCNSPFTVEEVRTRLFPEIHVETASYKRPEPYSGEITLTACNKGTGIQKILDFLGRTREDVIAFGDGANDIDMLDFAGVAVAMGNAREHVKKHADYVTTDVDQDGIYHAMKHLKLI